MKSLGWAGLRRQEAKPEPSELSELCGQTFGAGSGAKLLDLLHAMHVENVLADGASEAQLRAANARRALILEIEAATARGLKKNP